MAEPKGAAACPHFGTCGGCTLFDLPDTAYLIRKSSVLESALRRAGFTDVSLHPTARTGPGERRRMDLAARRTRTGVALGLHRHRSPEVVNLSTCSVLHPTLVALFPSLRDLARRLQCLRREASVIANLLDSGPDLLLRTDASLTLPDRLALTEFAHVNAVPRISWARTNDEPEPIIVQQRPIIALSGVQVAPPPGAFLQASPSGEAAIIKAVLAALPAKGRTAELYAGCGSLTFALASRTRVVAWEGDAASATALRTAAHSAALSGRVEVIHRDLARQPLQPNELSKFSAVVLDPPYAGAAVQISQIATAKVPVVLYVSCNPATLARDARTLRNAGYRLTAAQPIDQFLWSDELESVCTFVIQS
ncbi:MAG TPA: RsmD family RNA methyltransferase [Acetobacteraceae bacterium]|nr:RsmD family RNA methyltransferase [Acetobacteraceae bacterium]